MMRVTSSYKNRKGSHQYNEDGEDFIVSNESPMNRQDSRASAYRREGSHRKESGGRGDNLASVKWPTRLLSLVHPFNLDENVDH